MNTCKCKLSDRPKCQTGKVSFPQLGLKMVVDDLMENGWLFHSFQVVCLLKNVLMLHFTTQLVGVPVWSSDSVVSILMSVYFWVFWVCFSLDVFFLFIKTITINQGWLDLHVIRGNALCCGCVWLALFEGAVTEGPCPVFQARGKSCLVCTSVERPDRKSGCSVYPVEEFQIVSGMSALKASASP